MASLLRDPLFETSGRGPPPNKNFYYFSVTKSEVIWRWWKISLRAVDRHSRPGELKESHQDFLDDTWLQSEVSMVFGHQILQSTKRLCQGHLNYLEHLPDSLLLRIINDLELEDVSQLRRTSHRFRQLCESEEFWEQAVRRCCNSVSSELSSLALEVGWRTIFFTSKLQLQKLISRRRLMTEEQQEGYVSDVETVEEESPDESSGTFQTSSSVEESYSGISPDPSLGSDTGTGSDTSTCCDIDPDPEPETGSDSCMPVPDQLLDDIKNRVLETLVLNMALSNGRGDNSAVPDSAPT